MPTSKIIDLDAELGFTDDPVPTTEVKLLGRNWTVLCDLNSFAMTQIAGGDLEGIAKFLVGLVAEDQRADFGAVLASQKNLSAERLLALVQKLVEVAAERPSERPSPSPRTAKKPTSVRKSPAR